MTLREKQEKMVREINSLGDCFDQYSFLIFKASQLPPLPEEQRTNARLVSGCQSRVWLITETQDGIFHMAADSDTMLIRGILAVLMELLEGTPAREVAETEITLLRETELSATFTSDRTSGMRAILRQIRTSAQ